MLSAIGTDTTGPRANPGIASVQQVASENELRKVLTIQGTFCLLWGDGREPELLEVTVPAIKGHLDD